MSTAVAIREDHQPQALTVLSNDQLKFIAGTEFVPKGLRNNLPAILACVATGRAIGIDDMTAIRSIHIIDGKPTFAAELMVMLVRRRGHSIVGKVDAESATVTGTRADNGDTMTSTWTLEMAKRAGLVGKGNWKNYPEAMLWARAVSQLCRMLFADCFAGGTYTAEELGDEGSTGTDVVSPPVDEASDSDGGEAVGPSSGAAPSDAPPITTAQKKKANVLVGTLRDAGHITTEQLWDAMRPAALFDRPDDLHWGPLRDSLSKVEASSLIERLTKLEEHVAKVAAIETPGESQFKIPEAAQAQATRDAVAT